MRDLTDLDKYRIKTALFSGDVDLHKYGTFKVPVGKRMFFVVASVDFDGVQQMEHVSVSHRNEKITPSWDEMCRIKDMFFYPEEECYEIHPKHSEYVNKVANCLHIWRPVSGILFGSTIQNGAPTPENPAPLENTVIRRFK